jgi:hypothetical protein
MQLPRERKFRRDVGKSGQKSRLCRGAKQTYFEREEEETIVSA